MEEEDERKKRTDLVRGKRRIEEAPVYSPRDPTGESPPCGSLVVAGSVAAFPLTRNFGSVRWLRLGSRVHPIQGSGHFPNQDRHYGWAPMIPPTTGFLPAFGPSAAGA